jgi:transposase
MGFNFRACDRDQSFLLPPDLRDWLGEEDLAWTLIDVVDQMDLATFFGVYRSDGRGAAAFDPRMMVALLLYSYACGERSSRRIEQACQRDIGYRVICANQQPDHTTIARFRQRFERQLETLFEESVRLCMQVGLGKVGTVAIDGRKLAADASLGANRTADGIDREIRRWFEEAAAVDAAEDALYGVGKRGDELPPELRDRKSRRARLAQAKAELDAEREAAERERQKKVDRREAHKAEHGTYPAGRPPAPLKEQSLAGRKANVTDPQSRILKSRKGFVQGYNGQVVVSVDHIVVAAEVVREADDQKQLLPMIRLAQDTLDRAGCAGALIAQVIADGGYGTEDDFAHAATDDTIPELYVAITGGNRERGDRSRAPVADPESARGRMLEKMRTPLGRAIYKQRCHIVETIFGNQETSLRFSRFSRRGLTAARSEWHLVNAVHNLKKLHTAKLQLA